MTHSELTALLGGWEGYADSIGRATRRPTEHAPTLDHSCACGRSAGCLQRVRSTMFIGPRRLRAVGSRPIRFRCRLLVARSTPARELSRLRRLADSVARTCRILPIKQVSAYFGLS